MLKTDYPVFSNTAVNSTYILRNDSVRINSTIQVLSSPANVSKAFTEITFPNGTRKNITMVNGSNTNEWYMTFRETGQLGVYGVKIWANSTSVLWNSTASNITSLTTLRRNVTAVVTSCIGRLVFNTTGSNSTSQDLVPYNQTAICGAFNVTNSGTWNLTGIWMRVNPFINGYAFEVSTSGTWYRPTNLTAVFQILNNSSLTAGTSRMIWLRLDLNYPVLPWNGTFVFGPQEG